MKQLYYAIQTIVRGRGSNVMKVISLTLGLTIGILLFSQIVFELNYEKCYPESEQLAIIRARYTINNIPGKDYEETVEGTVAAALMENFPKEVNSATAFTDIFMRDLYKGDVKLEPKMFYADTLFFRTLGIKVLAGKPQEGLSLNNCAFISRAYAKQIFGDEDPMNKQLLLKKELPLTIKGVYEEIPENSTVQADLLISMITLDNMTGGAPQWGQNQVYRTIVRLNDASYFEQFDKKLQPMVEKYMSFRQKDDGYFVQYNAFSFQDLHTSNPDVQKRLIILGALAFSILFISIMNYVLVAISTMSRRAKMVGVHKCNGAAYSNILGMFLIETGIIILISLLFTAFMMLNGRDIIEDLLSTSLSSVFSWQIMWVPLLCIAVVFLIGGLLPGHIYAVIPATQVFRRYTDGKRGWKRSLLFIQFTGVSFILGLLLVTLLQYHRLMTQNIGYNPDGLVVASLLTEEHDHICDDIRRQPMVEGVAMSHAEVLSGLYYGRYISGDNGKSLFHTQFMCCDYDFPKVAGLQLVEGRWSRAEDEIVVNEEFVRKRGWKDSAIGKKPTGQWGQIVGVYKDYRTMGVAYPQVPVVLVPEKYQKYVVHVRLKAPFDENQKKLQEFLRETYPTVAIELRSVNHIREEINESTYRFRNSVWITSGFILLIVIMGLIGYVNDETQRRSKEIAVRKVNGAEAAHVLRLLAHDILQVSFPSVVIGTAVSYFVGRAWLEQFAEQIDLNPLFFVGVALAVLLIILLCVVSKAWRIANENPINSIKSE